MFQLPPSFLLEDVDQSVKYFTMRDICRQEAKHYRMTFFRGRVMITNERYPGRIKRAGAPQRMVHWSNQKHYSEVYAGSRGHMARQTSTELGDSAETP